jgi:hypothetical protein
VSHNPERDAAAYLEGHMSRRRRDVFQEHLLTCEACWQEVELARKGRALAESGRELAPQPVRERVRSIVAAADPPRRRRAVRTALIATGVAALTLGASAILLIAGDRQQPDVIDAVLDDFRNESDVGTLGDPTLPRKLGDLHLREARAGTLEGVDVFVHLYEDLAGHTVAVYQTNRTWPTAVGAAHSTDGGSWTAAIGGIRVFCVDDPVPSLVVGEDQRELSLAISELGFQ